MMEELPNWPRTPHIPSGASETAFDNPKEVKVSVCECSHENGMCGAKDANWYCRECKIYLAESCGCAAAHYLEPETQGHEIFKIHESGLGVEVMAHNTNTSFQMTDSPDAPVRETQVNIEVNNLLKNISLLEGDINGLVGRLEPVLRINPQVLKEKENDVDFVQLARTLHEYNMRLISMLDRVTYALGSLEL